MSALTKLTPQEILALPMNANDANAVTVRDYLIALVRQVITEEEGFSGKRPFGNSGWIRDLETPLVKAGAVQGELDEDGWLQEVDSPKAKALILKAVAAL